MRDEVNEPLGFPIPSHPGRSRAAPWVLAASATLAIAIGTALKIPWHDAPHRPEALAYLKPNPAPALEPLAALRPLLSDYRPSFSIEDRPSPPPAEAQARDDEVKVVRKESAGPTPLIIDVAQALAAIKRESAHGAASPPPDPASNALGQSGGSAANP